MRERYVNAGKEMKVKNGVGRGFQDEDMSGMTFIPEDWCENVIGKPWMDAAGHPAVLEYAVRTARNGMNNNVSRYQVMK